MYGSVGLATAVKLILFVLVLVYEPQNLWTDDTPTYIEPAEGLLSEGRFVSDGRPEVLRTPGYPLLLAAVLSVFGSPVPVVPVQILLGAAVALLVFRMVRSLEIGDLPSTVAGVAAFFFAWDPAVAVSQLQIMSESLFILLVVPGVLCLALFLKKQRLAYLLGGSVCLVSAAYVRPISLYLGYAVLVLVGVVSAWRFRGRERAVTVASLVACLFVYHAGVRLWMERNDRVAGVESFSTIAGVNLHEYIAAAAEARATDRSWQTVRREYRHRVAGAPSDVAVRDSLRKKLALDVMRRYPGHVLANGVQGLATILLDPGTGEYANLLGLRERDSGIIYRFYDMPLQDFVAHVLRNEPWLTSFLLVGGVWLFVFWVFTAVGIWDILRGGAASVGVWLLLVGALYLLVMAGGPNATARFRTPAVPFLAIFAGVGFVALLRSPKLKAR